MALKTFHCTCGQTWDALVSRETTHRICRCGQTGSAASVYTISTSSGAYASEFVWPQAMRDAHDEALGYKQEAIDSFREAVGNGFQWTEGS